MVEALMYLALSSDVRELGLELRHSWASVYVSSRTSAILRPEWGLQQQVAIGVAAGRVSWDVGLGGAYFEDPWPAQGTRLNYAISTRLSLDLSDRAAVFLEGRHWSNGGGSMHHENDYRNPSHNCLLAGLAYRF